MTDFRCTCWPNSEISPASGWWKPGEDLDERRLAGAVVADQPEHLALAQVQADVAQRRDRAEALGDVLDAQHVVGRARWLHCGRLDGVHSGFPRTRAIRYPSAIESRIAMPMKRSL